LCGSIVTPYPGTALYDWARESGRLPEEQEWREFYHQNEGMGLWDLSAETAGAVIRAWFQGIEAYNHRASRLIRRFASKFRSDPFGTIRRSSSLLRRKMTKAGAKG
jgi:hypothetical protein